MPYLCRQIVQQIKCKTMANPKKIKVNKPPFQVILCELNYFFCKFVCRFAKKLLILQTNSKMIIANKELLDG